MLNFIGSKQTIEEFIKDHKEKIEFKKINFDSITFTPMSHLKCMNCGMFRRNYHCLAVPIWRKAKEILSKYDNFYLVYIKISNIPRIKDFEEKRKIKIEQGQKHVFNDWLIRRNACGANQAIVKSRMKRFLVDLKKNFPNKKMRLFGSGGGCTSCKTCGLINSHFNQKITPCKKPNESFNAPESWGIDVYATLKNNNIEFEIIPEYNLITAGLITIKEN